MALRLLGLREEPTKRWVDASIVPGQPQELRMHALMRLEHFPGALKDQGLSGNRSRRSRRNIATS
jgi:hypothetical protein